MDFIHEISYDPELKQLSFTFYNANPSEIKTSFELSSSKLIQTRREIHEAVEKGDMKSIMTFLKTSAKIADAGEEMDTTLLHKASKGGYLNAVKFLIESGAKINAKMKPEKYKKWIEKNTL